MKKSVTMKDIAEKVGVSVMTVSAALGGNYPTINVSDSTRSRVLAVASEMNYRPNLVARSLVTRRTGVIGLVFPYADAFTENNPFFTKVMSGVLEAVTLARYNVMLHTAVASAWSEKEQDALLDPRVDGLILVLPDSESSAVTRCEKHHFPYVALVHKPASPDVYAVNADEYTGGLLATRHLLEVGHRRIVHFAGTSDVATAQPRKEGFLAALREAGIEATDHHVVPAGFGWKHGYAAIQDVLTWPESKRPTAIFAVNDLCAEGILRGLAEHGLRVPKDFALVGYDDTWFATMTQPPLTSVHMPIQEMALLSVQMLIAQIENRPCEERQPVLPVSLTVRESSIVPKP